MAIFRRFPTTFRRFPKIFQNLSEGQTNISRRSPKITEDYRGRPKKIRRCLNHTPTSLSVDKGTKKCYQKWNLHIWGHHLHIWGYHIVFINLFSLGILIYFYIINWKNAHSGLGCSLVSILRVVYMYILVYILRGIFSANSFVKNETM